MKKSHIIAALLLLSVSIYAQKAELNKEIKQKTDSILKEADQLYRYESAAWISTDMALAESDISKDFGGYLVMSSGDTVKAVVRSKKTGLKIYTVSFTRNPQKPVLVEKTGCELTAREQKLWKIKDDISLQVFSDTYKIGWPKGYNPVLELLPYENGYKFYILMGTAQRDLIPFGNDYVFFIDKAGKIVSWRKFHSRMIIAQTKIEGKEVIGLTHSHLQAEPYISATDICTFRLYAPMYKLEDFKVLSTNLSVFFTYNIKNNTISWELLDK